MTAPRRTTRLLRVVGIYLVDLLLANVELVRVVSMPQTPRPAVIALDLDTCEPWVITVLANMITVTPGTLTLEVAADASRLYVHVLTTRPLADHRTQLAALQRRILEVVT